MMRNLVVGISMLDQREIIWGVLAPPVLMAIGMVTTAYLPASRRFLSTGALLALVFGISHLGFRGWPLPVLPYASNDVHNWPAWIAFVAGLLTLCSACGHGPLVWRVLVRLALVGFSTWLLLYKQLQHGELSGAIAWLVGVTLVWAALVFVWERVHAVTTQGVSIAVLTTLAGVSAVSLLLFNTATHAQFAGILTAALTAALVLGWWKPAWVQATGPVTVTALVLPSLWVLGHWYADLPLWVLPLLAVAGLTPLVTTIARVRAWSDAKRLMITIAATLVLASPVLIWGVITSIKASSDYG
jgi:hypothetical protein